MSSQTSTASARTRLRRRSPRRPCPRCRRRRRRTGARRSRAGSRRSRAPAVRAPRPRRPRAAARHCLAAASCAVSSAAIVASIARRCGRYSAGDALPDGQRVPRARLHGALVGALGPSHAACRPGRAPRPPPSVRPPGIGRRRRRRARASASPSCGRRRGHAARPPAPGERQRDEEGRPLSERASAPDRTHRDTGVRRFRSGGEGNRTPTSAVQRPRAPVITTPPGRDQLRRCPARRPRRPSRR